MDKNETCGCWSGYSKKCRADGLEEGHGAAGLRTDGVAEVMAWWAALMAQVGLRYDGHLVLLGLGEHHIAAEAGDEHTSCGKQH